MLLRIWQFIVKEFIQFRRDRVLTLFLLIFPLLQLVLVAQTAGGDVQNLPLAVMDQDNSQVSRGLMRALDNTEELALVHFPQSMAEVTRLLDGNQAAAAVVVPPNFGRDLRSRPDVASGLHLQVLVDGSNISSSSAALAASEGALTAYLYRYLRDEPTWTGRTLAAQSLQAINPLDVRTTIRYNPELNGKYSAIPGLFAFVVYQVAMIVAAVSLVRERELGTLEQVAVTPVRRIELLSGKAIPAVIISMVNFTVLFLVVVGVFDIPMRGSWPQLFLLSTLFVISVVGVGLMISAASRSQQQAVLIVFPLAMIDLSLSGYLVPEESMPAALQVLSLFSPLRHYMTILKAVMLKGADLGVLWPSALALSVLAVAVSLLAMRNVVRSFE